MFSQLENKKRFFLKFSVHINPNHRFEISFLWQLLKCVEKTRKNTWHKNDFTDLAREPHISFNDFLLFYVGQSFYHPPPLQRYSTTPFTLPPNHLSFRLHFIFSSIVVKTQVWRSALLHLWHGETLSCEESETLVVRNPPKTVGPGLDWKEDFIVLRLAHWCRDTSAKTPNKQTAD